MGIAFPPITRLPKIELRNREPAHERHNTTHHRFTCEPEHKKHQNIISTVPQITLCGTDNEAALDNQVTSYSAVYFACYLQETQTKRYDDAQSHAKQSSILPWPQPLLLALPTSLSPPRSPPHCRKYPNFIGNPASGRTPGRKRCERLRSNGHGLRTKRWSPDP